MSLQQAIEILKAHNKCRRDNNVPSKFEMPDPEQIGLAIDRVIEEIEKGNK